MMMTHDMLLTELAAMDWRSWAFLIFASLPPLLVLYSKRVRGGRKWFWVILTSLFSWLAYVPFLFMTQAGGEKNGDRGEKI